MRPFGIYACDELEEKTTVSKMETVQCEEELDDPINRQNLTINDYRVK